MNKILLILIGVAFSFFISKAQNVGIGTTLPNVSAKLEVASTKSGFLPPRMTILQRDSIVNPAAGLLIYCIDCCSYGEIEVYNGLTWTNMIGGNPCSIYNNILVKTTTISSINSTTAVSGGTISNDGGSAITARGVVWSTNHYPTTFLNTKTTDGTGSGLFTSNISGLINNTKYYVRAYATNNLGTAYGPELSFITTLNTLTIPIVSTSVANMVVTSPDSSTIAFTAFGGGNVLSDGGSSITARGLVKNFPDSVINSNLGIGTGLFSTVIPGLKGNNDYYLKAFATNIVGTGYGENKYSPTFGNDSTLPSAGYFFNGNSNSFDNGYSGSSMNGTNSQLVLTTDRNNSSNRAYSFVGSSYISILPNTRFNISTGSLSCWFYRTNSADNDALFSVRNSLSNTRYSIHVSNLNAGIGMYNGSTYQSVPYSFSNNTWYHVVLVFKSTNWLLYVNGNYIGSVNQSIGTTTGNNVWIGQSDNTSNFNNERWNGKIDDIVLYNRLLTQEEISYIYTH